jgi:hypothetical protein
LLGRTAEHIKLVKDRFKDQLRAESTDMETIKQSESFLASATPAMAPAVLLNKEVAE